AGECADRADGRFHAEPISCPACGPGLRLVDRAGAERSGDPIRETAALLFAGAVVAVKGLGGYHLAATVDDETSVAALRARKHREDKPVAVMVPDVAAARRLAGLDPVQD